MTKAKLLISLKYWKARRATAQRGLKRGTSLEAIKHWREVQDHANSVIRRRESELAALNSHVHSPMKHITQHSWGYHPGVHDGVDLICPANEPLYAICDGVIVRADTGSWWGLGAPANADLRSKGDGIIVLRSTTDQGPFKKGLNFCYGHAEGPVVKKGQKVKAGQHIGHAGFANAWHTHFMVNHNNDIRGVGDRDPWPFVDYAIKHER